jgi:hypothetical protein
MPISYAMSAMPARYAVERGMWKEAADELEPRTSRFAFADAMVWFAKSLGAARSGDLVMAEKSAKVLGDTVNALKAAKNTYWATEVDVQHQTALAWIAYGRGDKEAALAQMRTAAGQAAEQTNNPDKAKMFYTKVTQLVGTADSRPEFKGVRAFLVKN